MRAFLLHLVLLWGAMPAGLWAQSSSEEGHGAIDARIHTVVYRDDTVYALLGYVGYQIDLEFAPDESFVGLSAGDIEGVTFAAQGNHLFLKPKASGVHTNVTVLTTRRVYRLDYVTAAGVAAAHPEMLYAVRFTYPKAAMSSASQPSVEDRLASARRAPPGARNENYWFCGRPTLQPTVAWDDGVQTYLRFDSRSELPALFVREEDGSESLLNFSVQDDEIVIHRIAKQFVVRRGHLSGCIVNRGFDGGSRRLDTGTIAPDVQRLTREPEHALE